MISRTSMQNEISKDMVGRYLKKTPASSVDAADKISHSYDRMKYDKEGGEKLKKKSTEELSKITGGLGLPTNFKLPFYFEKGLITQESENNINYF